MISNKRIVDDRTGSAAGDVLETTGDAIETATPTGDAIETATLIEINDKTKTTDVVVEELFKNV